MYVSLFKTDDCYTGNYTQKLFQKSLHFIEN